MSSCPARQPRHRGNPLAGHGQEEAASVPAGPGTPAAPPRSFGTSEQSRHPGWIPDSLTLTPLFPFILSVAKRSRRTRSCPLPDCSEVPEVASGFRVGKAGGKGDRQGTGRHFTASAGPASAPSGSAPRCAVVPPLPRDLPRQAISREAGSADAHLRHSTDAPHPVIPQTPIPHHSCGCPPRHSRRRPTPVIPAKAGIHPVSPLSLYKSLRLELPFSVHSIFHARFHFLTALFSLDRNAGRRGVCSQGWKHGEFAHERMDSRFRGNDEVGFCRNEGVASAGRTGRASAGRTERASAWEDGTGIRWNDRAGIRQRRRDGHPLE